MYLSIDHRTTYEYASTVEFSRNDVRLKPRPHPNQSVRSFSLSVRPSAETRLRTDYFGNNVHRCNVTEPHRALRIHVRSAVVTTSRSVTSESRFEDLDNTDPAMQEFLYPTDLIPLDRNWSREFEITQPDSSGRILDHLKYLLDQFRDQFTYDPEVTTVETDLNEFAAVRSGVCQDFAHFMAALCRERHLPTRYVSGYLLAGQGSNASHAWVEVHLPDEGWVGLDPTNNQFVDDRYAVVAYGRDYNDCSPVEGIRRGGGQDRMSVDVRVKNTPEGERKTSAPAGFGEAGPGGDRT